MKTDKKIPAQADACFPNKAAILFDLAHFPHAGTSLSRKRCRSTRSGRLSLWRVRPFKNTGQPQGGQGGLMKHLL